MESCDLSNAKHDSFELWIKTLVVAINVEHVISFIYLIFLSKFVKNKNQVFEKGPINNLKGMLRNKSPHYGHMEWNGKE